MTLEEYKNHQKELLATARAVLDDLPVENIFKEEEDEFLIEKSIGYYAISVRKDISELSWGEYMAGVRNGLIR